MTKRLIEQDTKVFLILIFIVVVLFGLGAYFELPILIIVSLVVLVIAWVFFNPGWPF